MEKALLIPYLKCYTVLSAMKIKSLKFVILIASAALLIMPVIIFFARAPVLIVAEQSFIALYGPERLRAETFRSMFALFRRVKTITAAQDAGDDIIRFAVQDVSKRPYCVIFPFRFARSAVIYHEYNPDIRLIILEGRHKIDSNLSESMQNDRFFIYKTDIEYEFHKAGYAASDLTGNETKTIIFFIDRVLDSINGTQIRNSFYYGVSEYNKTYFPSSEMSEFVFFWTISQYNDYNALGYIEISCVVMAGSGSEYFEKAENVPVILFSWLNPSYAPAGTAIVIDDSIWTQAVRAVKMADSGEKEGSIKSVFHILDSGKFNKEQLRYIGNLQQN